MRNKARREELANRFKDRNDPFKIVIVRDMWLTGFDAPSLHTMYLDKPMRGHGLMQAIARVNRVFQDKPGGLVVDYLGLADELQQGAGHLHRERRQRARRRIDQDEAVAVMLEKYEVCCGLFHGFDWSQWVTGTPEQRLASCPPARSTSLAQEDGKHATAGRRHRAVEGLCPGRAASTRPCAFATTWPSSRPCVPSWPRHARRAQDARRDRPRHPAD